MQMIALMGVRSFFGSGSGSKSWECRYWSRSSFRACSMSLFGFFPVPMPFSLSRSGSGSRSRSCLD